MPDVVDSSTTRRPIPHARARPAQSAPSRQRRPPRLRLPRRFPGEEIEIHPAELDLEPAISAITERAQHLTGATGAAIALRAGDEIVCRARAGRTAPDLGVRLQTDAGISAEAVRSGEIMLCHDAERNPRVDLASCRRLGVRSILVSPLRHYRRTLGVFEVLSSSPGAFDQNDVATMQLLSSMMVAAISRISSLHQAEILRRAS